MFHLLTLYKQPDDPDAFEDYYWNHHMKLKPAATAVGAKVGRLYNRDGSDADLYRIALVSFLDREQLNEALDSDESKALKADVANFASGGVIRLIFETDPIPVKPAAIAGYLRRVVPYKVGKVAGKAKRLLPSRPKS